MNPGIQPALGTVGFRALWGLGVWSLEFRDLKGLGGLVGLGIRASALGIVGFRTTQP